ncbi:NADH-quinone oxidoreductase subunit N [soil metagenome]
MLASVVAVTSGTYSTPVLDWHALAPELILVGAIAIGIIYDAFAGERAQGAISSIIGIGFLAALVPVLTLAVSDGGPREMFGGAYVFDDFALLVKGLFLVAGYVTVLLSTNTIAEGDYAEGEYYVLLVSSVLGMVVISSARDLITIFVALELLSIPAYLLAGWRKRARSGIEAGMKYYLMGVFASAVMLYGMSLIFGGTGSTLLVDVGAAVDGSFGQQPVAVLGIVFVLVGFAFKVSAVPFHNWAPDTYEGAPTPITAFLSVASKSAGFVAILQLVFIGFLGRDDVVRPLMFILAVLTMTVGNMIALRQSNIVRLFAYSSVAQAGFILAPLAVVSATDSTTRDSVLSSVVLYLVVYTIMNLGAFAVIIAVSRRTRSGEISSWGGLFTYAPGLAVAMAVFLFGLGGIPPAVGWIAKFQLFSAVLSAGDAAAYALAVVMAVNTVVSLAYYLGLMRTMFMDDAPDGDVTPVRIPVPLVAAASLAVVGTLGLGIYPNLVTDLADNATFLGLGR